MRAPPLGPLTPGRSFSLTANPMDSIKTAETGRNGAEQIEKGEKKRVRMQHTGCTFGANDARCRPV